MIAGITSWNANLNFTWTKLMRNVVGVEAERKINKINSVLLVFTSFISSSNDH